MKCFAGVTFREASMYASGTLPTVSRRAVPRIGSTLGGHPLRVDRGATCGFSRTFAD